MTEPKKSIADALNVTDYDESFEPGKSITEHSRELFEANGFGDLAATSGALLSDGVSFVGNAAMDVVLYTFDPVGWLTSHGLDMLLELIQPLQDALHQVTGDGPAIGHASENFVALAQGFVELANDFEKTGDTALKDWLDEAGDAARAALGDFSAGIRGVGSSAGSVADVLRMWSMVMVVIEDVIKALISEFASWAITVWAPALATSVISFGSTIAMAMTASINKAAIVFQKVTRHLGVFGKLLDGFMNLLQKFSGKILQLSEHLRVGVKAGSKKWLAFGKEAEVFIRSRRIITMEQKLAAGAGPLLTGMGIKAGIGVGKGVAGEAVDEVREDGTPFNQSEIDGDQSAEDTRKNLEM